MPWIHPFVTIEPASVVAVVQAVLATPPYMPLVSPKSGNAALLVPQQVERDRDVIRTDPERQLTDCPCVAIRHGPEPTELS